MSSTLQNVKLTVEVGPAVLYDYDEDHKLIEHEPQNWKEWFDLLKGVYPDMEVSVESPKEGIIVLVLVGPYINEDLAMHRFDKFLQAVRGIPVRDVKVTEY